MNAIFSGVSKLFEPIAGRVLLVRNQQDFDKLRNAQLAVKDLVQSIRKTERRVAEYFNDYTSNNLSLGKIVTNGIDDLWTCS